MTTVHEAYRLARTFADLALAYLDGHCDVDRLEAARVDAERALRTLDTEDARLRPCESCGALGYISHHSGIAINGWQVDCEQDKETGDGSHSTAILPTKAEAIAAWNR